MNKAMKGTQSDGSVMDEETTGVGGQYRTIVDPNPKCMGCLNYDNTRSHCTVAKFPASCGDGSMPETGYAPLVPNAAAHQSYRQKQGLAFNAPRSTVDAGPDGSGAKGPVGGDPNGGDFVVQVLGDEGNIQLSLRSILDGEEDALVKSDFALHHTVEGFMTNLKSLPKEGPTRGKFITAHMSHGPFLQALQKHPQGKNIHAQLTAHLNSPKNATIGGAGVKATAKSLEKSAKWIQGQLKAGKTVKHESGITTRPSSGGKFAVSHPSWGAAVIHSTAEAAAKHAQTATANPTRQTWKSMSKTDPSKCMKCGSLMKGSSCSKCKYKSLRTTVAFDGPNKVGGPVSKGSSGGPSLPWKGKKDPRYKAPASKPSKPKLTAAKFLKQRKQQAMTASKTDFYSGTKKSAPWAIADEVWAKLPMQKRAPYFKKALARGFAKSYGAPREFMHRLVKKSGPSFVEEFGHRLAGVLFKARRDIIRAVSPITQPLPKVNPKYHAQMGAAQEAASDAKHNAEGSTGVVKPPKPRMGSMRTRPHGKANPAPKKQPKLMMSLTKSAMPPKPVGGASPILGAVRRKQMQTPSPASQLKAQQAGGGKTFPHTKLAEHLGVKPEGIAEMAHGSLHSSDFAQKIRKQAGDKVKHLTDGQLRSAYHSTGLMHSLTANDLDVIKSMKSKKRIAIGHTASGKAINNDAHGAEEMGEEDHRDAGDVHNAIANRLSDAAFGFGGGTGQTGLSPTSKKYLNTLSKHHSDIARRHHHTASHLANKRYSGPGANPSYVAPVPFASKSMLVEDTSDEAVAKAIMAGGGAGTLSIGAMVSAPLNVNLSKAARGSAVLNLQEDGAKVLIPDAPVVEEKLDKSAGGLTAGSWDVPIHLRG